MLTLFAAPKPFKGRTAIIQRNAVKSWTLLSKRPEIILFGHEEGVADICHELHLRHVSELGRNAFGTPRVDALFQTAQKIASYPLLAYVNADIILMSDFVEAVNRLQSLTVPFMAAGQRWDVDLETLFDYSGNWEKKLRERVAAKGKLHAATGMDYFIFSPGLLKDIPPFAIGRTAWDPWLVYAGRKRGMLVDATGAITAIHQNHDYAHHPEGAKGVWDGPEAIENQRLAGYFPRFFTIRDSSHRLGQKGLTRNRKGIFCLSAFAAMAKDCFFKGQTLLKFCKRPFTKC